MNIPFNEPNMELGPLEYYVPLRYHHNVLGKTFFLVPLDVNTQNSTYLLFVKLEKFAQNVLRTNAPIGARIPETF